MGRRRFLAELRLAVLFKDSGSVLHCSDDILVAGASTQIARNPPSNFLLARMRILLKQCAGCHDHARCAEAALKTVFLFEPFLNRMQFAVRRDALDRSKLAAICLHCKQGTRLYRFPIQKDGACAAVCCIASDMCACRRRTSRIKWTSSRRGSTSAS